MQSKLKASSIPLQLQTFMLHWDNFSVIGLLGLASVEPNRKLYLAVPVDVYKTFFQSEFTQTAVQEYQVLLIVYDQKNEVIMQWTS